MYQREFQVTNGFREYCLPFIKDLPLEKVDPPLRLAYPSHALNKVRWQWYNFLKHKASGRYRIACYPNPANLSEEVVEISRKDTTEIRARRLSSVRQENIVPTSISSSLPMNKLEEIKLEKYGPIGTPERDAFEKSSKKEAEELNEKLHPKEEKESTITKLFGPDSGKEEQR